MTGLTKPFQGGIGMRQSRIIKRLSFLVAGAICLNTVYCTPRADTFRALIQSTILGVVQAALTTAIDAVIPNYDPDTTATE
jgi:hypothetical protein